MKPKNSALAGSPNQSVAKALQILRVFTQQTPRLRLKDISQRTGINQATASRLLATMREQGFILQEGGYYCLGWQEVLRMEGVVLQSMSLRQLSMPYLEQLSLLLRKNVNLAVLDRTEVVYLYRAEGEEGSRGYYHAGMRRPAHCTALGKVLLCATPEQAEPMFEGVGPRRFTFSTITDREAYMAELEKTALQGYGTDMEECIHGYNCVAVPILGLDGGVCAAISVSGPSNEFGLDEMQRLLPHLRNTAQKILLQLGSGEDCV